MEYFLLLAAVVISVANSSVMHVFANKGLRNHGDVFLFICGTQFIWTVLLFAFSAATDKLIFSRDVILYGLLYGLLLFFFQIFKLSAMSSGPVSLTNLIGASSFLISSAYSYFVLNERINPLCFAGVLLLILSLYLCIDLKGKATGENMKLSPRWLVLSFCLFLVGGVIGILYMHFNRTPSADNVDPMMLLASGVSSLLLLAAAFGAKTVKKTPAPRLPKSTLKYLFAVGVTGCVYMRLNIGLVKLIPGILLFPLTNASIILLSTVAGRVLFREKLNRRQLIGILIGLFAVVFIGVTK
ncbi:MAG: EamA family transporter [Clostridia bacterium]|nr:EamA family transporter [Clostridia bacterium]